MTPIRTRDVAFLSVAVPAAALAAYVWLWRIPEARAVRALEAERAALVAPEDFADHKASAAAALASAREALAREKEIPPPPLEVAGGRDAPFAERELAVLSVFREAGVAVLRAVDAKVEGGTDADGSEAAAALTAAGGPRSPRCRRYVLDAPYPAVRRAFALLVERKAPAIPAKAGMDGAGRWETEIWE